MCFVKKNMKNHFLVQNIPFLHTDPWEDILKELKSWKLKVDNANQR